MRVRNEVIVVVAVFVAVLALAANALAHTRAVEQHAENTRIAAAAAWAEPFVVPTTTSTSEASIPARSESDGPLGEASTESSAEPSDDDAQELQRRDKDEKCDKSEETSEEPRNHGCEVSSFASDPDSKDGIKGPPGAEISEIARPEGQDDGPPRSDRAEENQDRDTDSEDKGSKDKDD
jgi:hypothetical protein